MSGRCVPTVCTPGQTRCLDSTTAGVCNTAGTDFEPVAVRLEPGLRGRHVHHDCLRAAEHALQGHGDEPGVFAQWHGLRGRALPVWLELPGGGVRAQQQQQLVHAGQQAVRGCAHAGHVQRIGLGLQLCGVRLGADVSGERLCEHHLHAGDEPLREHLGQRGVRSERHPLQRGELRREHGV